MDVAAGRDFLAGEADDLAVLADGFALGDGANGDLVAEADAAIRGEDGAVELVFLARREGPGGDGNVVFRRRWTATRVSGVAGMKRTPRRSKGTRSR